MSDRRLMLTCAVAATLLFLPGLARGELVGLWRFDADVSPQPDSSGNGHDAEPMNDVMWVNDPTRGGVMEFDGDQDYLEVEDTDLLSIEGDLTIAAWANFVSYDSWNSIVSKTGSDSLNVPAPYDVYTNRNGDGRPHFHIGDGSAHQAVDAIDPADLEEWTHIAVTFTEDGEVVHYLNGEDNGEGFLDMENLDNDTNLYIGSRADFVTNMWGWLDDVAIFNEVLSQDQIRKIMGGDFSDYIGPILAGDFNGDGELNALDIDALTAEVNKGTNDLAYDLNGDSLVNSGDRDVWVVDLKNTWYGDSNLDGEFNSSDFVLVFQRNKYEDAVADNAGWGDGDWNGDLDFDSSDFVVAFQGSGFEQGPRPMAGVVPEPSGIVLLGLALTLICRRRQR